MTTPLIRKGGDASGRFSVTRRKSPGPRPAPTASAESLRDTAPRPCPAKGSWVFQIPRPPSLNEMIGANRYALARRKKKYLEAVRWCLKGDPEFRARLPFARKIFVRIVILGLWPRHTPPDKGNWEKWIGDALAGFVIRDDGDAFWNYRVSSETGRPAAVLYITELDEVAPEQKPRRSRCARLLGRGRWPIGLVKIRSPRGYMPARRKEI